MKPSDLDRCIELGVYDPEAPGADERLGLVEFLLQLGATPEEMANVKDLPGGLPGLASIAAMPKPTVSLRDLATRIGVTVDFTLSVWTALGLILPDPDRPVLSEDEAVLLTAMTPGLTLLPDQSRMQLLRAAGNSSARLADALVQMYLTDMETSQIGELARAQLAAMSAQMLDANVRALEVVLKRHMTQAAFRLRASQVPGAGHAELSIGFIDLVGFTSLSLQVASDELMAVLDEFEALATERVNANGGWVIKLIGDEVMYAAVEPQHAVQVAVAVMEALGIDRPGLTPSGGLACGAVVPRGGDYFGPVVNLAARAASEAVAGEVLVTRRVRDGTHSLPEGWMFEPAGHRKLKGIDEPVALWSLRREAEEDE